MGQCGRAAGGAGVFSIAKPSGLSSSLKLVCIKGAELDSEFPANTCQTSVGGVKQVVCFPIIFWFDPLLFEFSPQGLGKVQFRRIRREKEEVKTSLLPKRDALLNNF